MSHNRVVRVHASFRNIRSQYGGPLYAFSDHDQGECPWYAQDDLWHFKYGANERERFDNALEHIHNLSLTAEVAHFCEASCLFFIYQEEVHKIEECMWEAGQLKDVSAHRLEGANALHRIKAAAEELDVTDAHILSYFSVFYMDLFDEVFVFESLSLDMIRWLVTCCHHVHS